MKIPEEYALEENRRYNINDEEREKEFEKHQQQTK